MTKKLDLYRCEKCGNLIEVVLEGSGELVCCGEVMKYLEPDTTDGDSEKHVPVFVKKDDELDVRVGTIDHPMTNEHYIQFIECISKDEIYVKRKYLYPNREPVLNLNGYDLGNMTAKEYCNIHGLWEGKND